MAEQMEPADSIASLAADPFIKLDQFLKLAGVVSTGGQAKQLILAGQVWVNGQVETRRGRKLRVGDEVGVLGQLWQVHWDAEEPDSPQANWDGKLNVLQCKLQCKLNARGSGATSPRPQLFPLPKTATPTPIPGKQCQPKSGSCL
ncbi:MAG: RNA-binding S4 domain-containing protein [Cyanobacteriota bacterium]